MVRFQTPSAFQMPRFNPQSAAQRGLVLVPAGPLKLIDADSVIAEAELCRRKAEQHILRETSRYRGLVGKVDNFTTGLPVTKASAASWDTVSSGSDSQGTKWRAKGNPYTLKGL